MAAILKSVTLDGLMHKIVRFYGGGHYEFEQLPCGEALIKDRTTGETKPGVKVALLDGAWALVARS